MIRKILVLYVPTLDLIENALELVFVCSWKVGPYVCLGNAEMESQCSQGKEDTKLSRNVYTSKAEIAMKILTASLEKKFF